MSGVSNNRSNFMWLVGLFSKAGRLILVSNSPVLQGWEKGEIPNKTSFRAFENCNAVNGVREKIIGFRSFIRFYA